MAAYRLHHVENGVSQRSIHFQTGSCIPRIIARVCSCAADYGHTTADIVLAQKLLPSRESGVLC
jgi:hypothetical protein